ncbi:hydroxyphenylacetyl-CoA thioesterase PaaI [Jiangella sp. DSM 45060]|uniref:hydroxyphenylacetyl-CoA thioesterase PaaI n=1 Tax=Jiangella sp. DSM 45060 TaxID=1798224 RepID=UPI00087D774F|nr:hydroxyphenylacetyl-CoA thioesterase PaaI [Jiangella sp. DSM 45060]SDT67370.1 3-hydroxybutyryl-CoA dehydrogenase [Jiangella sp. DSM 45060]
MDAIARSVPVGVIGAGTMGAGIAQVAAAAGHEVRVYDAARGAAEAAVDAVFQRLARAVDKGRLLAEEAEDAASRLHAVTTLDDLAGCGLVIEAVVEDLEVKRALFTGLEAVCGPDAVLTTNTSSLSVDAIAAELAHPGRFAGLHFFNPAPLLPLVEVVSGAHTDAAVADVLVATARAWGKTPVRAASTPGFIVNRVARPFYGEAFRLLESGRVDAATVDALLRESGGFRMGPFELADLIGHDVNLAVSRSVWEAFGRDPRFTPSVLQERLVADGRLGRKSGGGIYPADEPPPAPPTADPVTAAPDTWAGAGELDPSAPGWSVGNGDVELRPADGRTAAQHTGGGPRTVVLVDLALDRSPARVGVAAPEHAPKEHVEAAVGFLQSRGFAVTLLPDLPGLVVARTVATLAAAAADAVDSGVATADDVDTAMRLGTNYPRGPYEWGTALGWDWVTGVLDALAATADDPGRYRVSARLRDRASARDHRRHDLARRAAEAMLAGDAASRELGMTLDDIEPGAARVSMRVRADMLNGHGICHGGLIFTLADTAFAVACNSYNRSTVAQGADIAFLAPAHEGDQLLAVAEERHRGERSGVYDVTVYRDGAAIAEFRGRSREIPGTLVPGEEDT